MSKAATLSLRGAVAYGALLAHYAPYLAMDAAAKVDLVTPLLGVNTGNFKSKRASIKKAIHAAVAKHLQPKYAQDASIKEGLDSILDMIEPKKAEDDKITAAEKEDDNEEEEDNEDRANDNGEENAEAAESEAEDGDPDDEEKKRLQFSKDKKAKDKKAKDNKPAAGARDKKAKDESDEKDKKEDKKAMDAATDEKVRTAIKQERELQQAIYAAKDHVRGRVGELATMAFDSVEGVYLHAIKAAGKDPKPLEGSKPAALKFVFDNLPPPAGTTNTRSTFAFDGGTGDGSKLSERHPNIAKNLNRIGAA